jgi:Tfp pilus assembly protein PilO
MKSRAVVLGVLLTIVVVMVWNLLIFAPKGRHLSAAKKDAQAAQTAEVTLRSQLDRLVQISHNGPEIAAELGKLSAAVPSSPDLDGFILSANQIAVQSGIDFLSVAPSIIQAGTTGPSVIPLSIQVQGGFFQVLDYLNRLEDMGRLVVVDAINVTSGAASGGSSSAGQVPTGPPKLAVSLTARMFTRAAPTPAGGSTPPAGPVGGTSNSTPPASGNSSGATSTSAQVN